MISSEIDIRINRTTFYIDSYVILGYIHHNKNGNFYAYVINRFQRLRESSHPEQWLYAHTDYNPADCATRSVPAGHLPNPTWLGGPTFLSDLPQRNLKNVRFNLVNTALTTEIQTNGSTLSTSPSVTQIGTQGLARFSTWKSPNCAVVCLAHIIDVCRKTPIIVTARSCNGWYHCHISRIIEEFSQSKNLINRAVQTNLILEKSQVERTLKKCTKAVRSRLWIHFSTNTASCGLVRVSGGRNLGMMKSTQ